MYGQTPLDFGFTLLSALTALVLAAAFLDFAAGHRQLRFLKDVPPALAGPPLSLIAAARNEGLAHLGRDVEHEAGVQ